MLTGKDSMERRFAGRFGQETGGGVWRFTQGETDQYDGVRGENTTG